MKGSIAAGCVAILALGLFASPLRSQTTVQGSVVVHSGPVSSEVEVRRRARVIVPERHVIVVNRVAPRRVGWWKNHGYRVVTVYYDGHRYYLRRFARPHLRPVIVYERSGRYYIDENHWKRKHRQHGRQDDRFRDDD